MERNFYAEFCQCKFGYDLSWYATQKRQPGGYPAVQNWNCKLPSTSSTQVSRHTRIMCDRQTHTLSRILIILSASKPSIIYVSQCHLETNDVDTCNKRQPNGLSLQIDTADDVYTRTSRYIAKWLRRIATLQLQIITINDAFLPTEHIWRSV